LSPVLMLASAAADDPSRPADVRSEFDVIRRNVELEARLIDDLLDLTRISRGKMTIQPGLVDVHAMLRNALETVRREMQEKKISLELQLEAAPSVITADPARLQQVFWNLLSNATKFSGHGGTVRVGTRQPASDSRRIVVTVSDDGIGMTSEEIAHGFEPFAQGEHVRSVEGAKYGGLGLGLAISQQITQLMGGSISLQSAGTGRGCTVTVEFPLADPTAERKSPAPAAATPLGRKGGRVLVVEDHRDTRQALVGLLKGRRYAVTAAASVAQAMEQLGRAPYDLMISDLGLPDGDGYKLMRAARELQPELVGIALSGYGSEDDRRRAIAAGFADHLTKPVVVDHLCAIVAARLPRPEAG
jgi:CheY-like chemotaxis protein